MSRLVNLLSLLIIATAAMGADGGPAPAGPAPAPTGAPAGGAQSAPDPFGGSFWILIIGMILFMWLLVIRPQRREEKRRKELIDALKPGHQVVTIGGIHGEVVAVGENTIDLAVTKGDKPQVMTFNRGAVATNVTLTAEAAKPAK